MLNTLQNTREQIYLKIQEFQQQGTTENTRKQIYLLSLKIQGFQQQGNTRDQLLDITVIKHITFTRPILLPRLQADYRKFVTKSFGLFCFQTHYNYNCYN